MTSPRLWFRLAAAAGLAAAAAMVPGGVQAKRIVRPGNPAHVHQHARADLHAERTQAAHANHNGLKGSKRGMLPAQP